MRGGVRSLLVTDIVGSTRLWAEYEPAMAVDLAVHDEIVRAAIASAGGRVFKHTGDGVMATFAGAGASAGAAAEIQRAMGEHVWEVPEGIRVRVALHSGTVHERDGDLFGPSVNRLARLLSRCSPGAVIVSHATAVLLADGMSATLELRDLGRVELRDVEGFEPVHCLVGAGLAAVDPQDAVGPADRRAGSLPRVDDDLVGRTAEFAAVLDAIVAHPVVSIVGVGGMGKTRLALEAAAVVDVAGGAWWCDLTAATSPDAVPATLLAALGGHQSGGRTAVDCIVDHLAGEDALVVLDNCEHVIDAAHALVSALRAGCAEVRVLTTSREALGIRGEQVVILSSLPPDDAIGLFCSRASEARVGLEFDGPTLEAIDEVCTRLDGIPLAIELAAARCRSMTPAEIAARLGDRFRLLRGGRDRVERHRTLQAAVEWSYSLLEDDERDAFDRLAVLAGGGLIDTVAPVIGQDEYDALDVLDRLVARSMVIAVDTSLGTRYRQLETLRQFAEDRLVEHGLASETSDRYLDWARSLATWMRDSQLTSAEVVAFRRYVAEIDNFRAAVRDAVNGGRYQEACEVVAGIAFPATCRPTFEVIDWVDVTRVAPEQWTDAVASTAGFAAGLALFAGDVNRTAELVAAIPEAHRENPWVLIIDTYISLFVTGDIDAAEDRLRMMVPVNEQQEFAWAQSQGQVFQWRLRSGGTGDAGYTRAALSHCEHFLGRTRDRDAQLSLAVALFVYGFCLEGAGDLAGAIEMHSESIERSEAAGAGFLVDAARVGLMGAIVKLAATDSEDVRDSVATLRSTIAAALQRGNNAILAGYFATAVERLLWVAGDHRTAALLGQYGRLQLPAGAPLPSAVDVTIFDAETTAGIAAEAVQLDLETAGAIVLAALARLLDASD